MGWLPEPNRRWIAVNALGVTAIVNVAVTAVVAWVTVGGVHRVPLWSTEKTSMVSDSLGTLFTLPLITCLLATTAVRRDLRAGNLERISGLGRHQPLLALLPGSRLFRGIALGVACFGILALPVTLLLVAVDLGDLSSTGFVAYKVAFTVVLGAVVTPLVAVRAMADRLDPAERAPAPARRSSPSSAPSASR